MNTINRNAQVRPAAARTAPPAYERAPAPGGPINNGVPAPGGPANNSIPAPRGPAYGNAPAPAPGGQVYGSGSGGTDYGNVNGSGGAGLTMRDLLRESIGYYIIAQHLIGVSELIAREGVLTRVEANCYVLHDMDSDSDLICDYFSLKFFRRLPINAKPGYHELYGGADTGVHPV